MKIYQGQRHDGITSVGVDGIPLPQRQDLYNHSPTGFEWGYLGSGPAQLALAILADSESDDFALKHYQKFKEDIIAPIQTDAWMIKEIEISAWIIRLLD